MVGVALEGGAVRGAFHMGVVRALLEAGYEIGGVTGTSIGALNGAIVAQGSFEEGYKIWQRILPSDVFDVDDEEFQRFIKRQFDRETALKFASRLSQVIRNRGVDTGKLKSMIQSIVDEERLRASPIDFGLVTFSLSGLKPVELYKEEIPKGMMVDYLIASANFPGFKLKEIDNKYYIDGGLYDNCPINLLARKGYKEIIAVRTLGPGFFRGIKYPDVKVTHVFPSESLGRLFDFSRDLIDRNLEMGYYDGMRITKGLKGKKYYIDPPVGEDLHHALCAMPEKYVVDLGKLFGIGGMDPGRMLFERIIPEIGSKLGLKQGADYADIVVGLLERIAEEAAVPRFRIYSLGGLLHEIRSKMADSTREKATESGLRALIKAKITDGLTGKHTLLKASQLFSEGLKMLN
jgi:NTE family protein